MEIVRILIGGSGFDPAQVTDPFILRKPWAQIFFNVNDECWSCGYRYLHAPKAILPSYPYTPVRGVFVVTSSVATPETVTAHDLIHMGGEFIDDGATPHKAWIHHWPGAVEFFKNELGLIDPQEKAMTEFFSEWIGDLPPCETFRDVNRLSIAPNWMIRDNKWKCLVLGVHPSCQEFIMERSGPQPESDRAVMGMLRTIGAIAIAPIPE